MENFNELSPAETERLAILSEELGEVQQIVGKILRHGWYSEHPKVSGVTNQDYLEKELGDVQYIVERMVHVGDINRKRIEKNALLKAVTIKQYTHHQEGD